MPDKQYQMSPPTAESVLRLITKTMGTTAGTSAWRTACEASGRQWQHDGGRQWQDADYEVTTLIAILEKMTLQFGLAETVARSALIRLHSWNVLAKMSKIRALEGD